MPPSFFLRRKGLVRPLATPEQVPAKSARVPSRASPGPARCQRPRRPHRAPGPARRASGASHPQPSRRPPRTPRDLVAHNPIEVRRVQRPLPETAMAGERLRRHRPNITRQLQAVYGFAKSPEQKRIIATMQDGPVGLCLRPRHGGSSEQGKPPRSRDATRRRSGVPSVMARSRPSGSAQPATCVFAPMSSSGGCDPQPRMLRNALRPRCSGPPSS